LLKHTEETQLDQGRASRCGQGRR